MRSFPGMGLAEMITVSFAPIVTLLNSPSAMRVSALIGSPCEPVEMMTISRSKKFLVFSTSTRTPSGILISPIFAAASTTLNILRPESATFRLYFTAISMICCKRCTLEANVAIISRLSACAANRCSSVVPTTFSLMVKPCRSMLVDSPKYSSTPRLP